MSDLSPRRPSETEDAWKQANADWQRLQAVMTVCDACGCLVSHDPSPVGESCDCGGGILRAVVETDLIPE